MPDAVPDETGRAGPGPGPTRLVVVGGGVAGLQIATRLGDRLGRAGRLAVTLVDSDSAHVWKPMLHTIAAGTSDVHRARVPFLSHAHRHGFSYIPGELGGLDRIRKVVQLAPLTTPYGEVVLGPREVAYDTLVLAIGSRANDFGTPGVDEHCHVVDSRREAVALNLDVRLAMLRSLTEARALRIAIVGGGATGVELAAELVQLVDAAAAYGATTLRANVAITLVDSGTHLLAAFPEHVSSAATRQLIDLGVAIRHEARVARVTADRLELQSGESIGSDITVWAAGTRGPDCLSRLDGLETSRGAQLTIRPTLQVRGDDAIFAVGDCASLTLPGEDRPLPPTAQVAQQQAQHLIRNLPGWLDGAPIPAFRFRDLGSLVSIGPYNAFGSLGKFGFFKGAFIRGHLTQLGHAWLYRSYQARLHGIRGAAVLWIIDQLSRLVGPRVTVD